MRPETRPDYKPRVSLLVFCVALSAGDGSRLASVGPGGLLVPKGSEEVSGIFTQLCSHHRGQRLTHRAELKQDSASIHNMRICTNRGCPLQHFARCPLCFLPSCLGRAASDSGRSGSFRFTSVFCCLVCKPLATGKRPTVYGVAPEPCPLARVPALRRLVAKPAGMAAGDEPLSRPCRVRLEAESVCSSRGL